MRDYDEYGISVFRVDFPHQVFHPPQVKGHLTSRNLGKPGCLPLLFPLRYLRDVQGIQVAQGKNIHPIPLRRRERMIPVHLLGVC